MGKLRLAAAVVLIGLGVPCLAQATSLACRPGVSVRTYATARFITARKGDEAIHRLLERYASRAKLTYGSVGGDDPYMTPPGHTMTSILQTRSYGLAISVDTSNRSNVAKIKIENNCWAAREDWRPAWAGVISLLEHHGYRRVARRGPRRP